MGFQRVCCNRTQQKSCDCRRLLELKKEELEKIRAELKFVMALNQDMAGKSKKNNMVGNRAADRQKVQSLEQSLKQSKQIQMQNEQMLQQQIFFLRRSNDSLSESIKVQTDRFQTMFSELREQMQTKNTALEEARHEVQLQVSSAQNYKRLLNQMEQSNTNLKVALMNQQQQLEKQLDNNRMISGQIEELIRKRKQPVQTQDLSGLHNRLAELSRQNIELRRRNECLVNEMQRFRGELKEVNRRELEHNQHVYSLRAQLQSKQTSVIELKRQLLQLKQLNRLS